MKMQCKSLRLNERQSTGLFSLERCLCLGVERIQKANDAFGDSNARQAALHSMPSRPRLFTRIRRKTAVPAFDNKGSHFNECHPRETTFQRASHRWLPKSKKASSTMMKVVMISHRCQTEDGLFTKLGQERGCWAPWGHRRRFCVHSETPNFVPTYTPALGPRVRFFQSSIHPLVLWKNNIPRDAMSLASANSAKIPCCICGHAHQMEAQRIACFCSARRDGPIFTPKSNRFSLGTHWASWAGFKETCTRL
jgi:hypothetical protein